MPVRVIAVLLQADRDAKRDRAKAIRASLQRKGVRPVVDLSSMTHD